MAKIALTGGTGLIGSYLIPMLLEKGHEVNVIGRGDNPPKNLSSSVNYYQWNPTEQTIDENALKEATHVIHLAGAPVNQKWNKKGKKQILESRSLSTQLLVNQIIEHKIPIQNFISASGINYYGYDCHNIAMEEHKPMGDGFLAKVCGAWEQASEALLKHKIKRTVFRIGVVFTPKGGPLHLMKLPFKFWAGSAIGSGNQFIPWIHYKDVCGALIQAVEDKDTFGTFNLTAPNPATNRFFTKILRKVYKQPIPLPPVPAFALKMLMGKRSILATGNMKASVDQLLHTGFAFQFPELEGALVDLIKGKQNHS